MIVNLTVSFLTLCSQAITAEEQASSNIWLNIVRSNCEKISQTLAFVVRLLITNANTRTCRITWLNFFLYTRVPLAMELGAQSFRWWIEYLFARNRFISKLSSSAPSSVARLNYRYWMRLCRVLTKVVRFIFREWNFAGFASVMTMVGNCGWAHGVLATWYWHWTVYHQNKQLCRSIWPWMSKSICVHQCSYQSSFVDLSLPVACNRINVCNWRVIVKILFSVRWYEFERSVIMFSYLRIIDG